MPFSMRFNHCWSLVCCLLIGSVVSLQEIPVDGGERLVMSDFSEGLQEAITHGDGNGILAEFLKLRATISNRISPVGGFERVVLTYSPTSHQPQLMRSTAEWQKNEAALWIQDYFGAPYLAIFQGDAFLFNDGKTGKLAPSSWSMVTGDPDYPMELRVGNQVDQLGNLAALNPRGLVEEHLADTKATCSWHPEVLTLLLRLENKKSIRIRFRSPSDSRLFNYSISEISGTSADGLLYASWSGCHQSSLGFVSAFPIRNSSDVAKQLGEYCLPVTKVDWDNLRHPSLQKAEGAIRLWHVIMDRPVVDMENVVQRYQDLSEEQRIAALAYSYGEIFDLQTETGRDAFIAECWRLLGWLGDQQYKTHGNILDIDDESIRWRITENVVDPTSLWAVYTTVLRQSALLRSRDIQLNSYLHLAQLGHPPFDGGGKEFSAAFKDPLVKALFKAHWQWPADSSDIEACTKTLQQYKVDSIPSNAATQSLIMFGRLDLIPEPELEAWYRRVVRFADNDARRMRMLSRVSFSTSGRGFLLKRLNENTTDSATLSRMVIHVLQARVKAVRSLERYDFISKDLCEEIESL